MINISDYDLTDRDLFSGKDDGFIIWRPDDTVIVLGQADDPSRALFSDNVIEDSVRVMRRPTGGSAVVLTPSMLVVSVAKSVLPGSHFRDFFSAVNSVIIDSLSQSGIRGAVQRGISDIALGDRKILGSSMASHGNRRIYHAVLNLAGDKSLFGRYLRHPVREPDYRSGRSHGDFVTSLKDEGFDADPDAIEKCLSVLLQDFISRFSVL